MKKDVKTFFFALDCVPTQQQADSSFIDSMTTLSKPSHVNWLTVIRYLKEDC